MRVIYLLAVAPLFLTGCNRADGDKLARIGWKVSDKVQALVPSRTPFGDALPPAKTRGPEERVRERFRLDRYLNAAPIEVSRIEQGVRLTGQVDDEVLKRRAVEIAESTTGVERVVDEIAVRK